MAKVSVVVQHWDSDPTVDVYEGDVDASIHPENHLLIIDNSALKPKLKAIYAVGTWDKVTLDD